MNTIFDAAVLGVGNMGGVHVIAAKASPYIKKIYGYEPDPIKAAQREKDLGITCTSEINSILNNQEIKFVSIASTNSTHAELAEKALRAGKAVLCEKPMGETLEEAKRMIKAQKETCGFLQIGFELHYSKLFIKAKDWIDNGLIGAIVNIHCRYYSSEFHGKNSWRSCSKGTLIGEKLSHYIDLIRWWIGSPVEEVYSFTAPNVVKYFNHPDNHQINLRFANGSIANLNFIMFIAETDHGDPLLDTMEKMSDDGHCLQYHIIGDKGAIEIDAFRRRIRRWEFSEDSKQLTSKIVDTFFFPKNEGKIWYHNVHGQITKIIELVAKKLPPENPANDSYQTMLVCFAAEKSEQKKCSIKISEYE